MVCPHLTSSVSKLGVGKVFTTNTPERHSMLWDTAPLSHIRSSNSHLEQDFLQKRLRNVGFKILFSHLLAPVCSTCLSSHCSISLYPEHKCLSHYQINQPVVQLPPTSLSVLPLARQHNPLHSPTFPPVKESLSSTPGQKHSASVKTFASLG